MIEIPYNNKRIEQNEERYGCNDGTHCIICNAPVNPDQRVTYFVRVIASTDIGTPEEAKKDPSADMGWYPIGNDCLRRHPELRPYADKLVWGISVKVWPV